MVSPAPSALDLRCPLLPQTLTEAATQLGDPDNLDVNRVIALVERDPVLLTQLLKSVNSAYYGLSRTITSPDRAVMLLGPVTVVGLVAGMSLTRLRAGKTPEAAAASQTVIAHSLATAYLAQRLVESADSSTRPAQSGEAYTAGLLHDFGKLVLLHNFPEVAPLYLNHAAESSQDLHDREREATGFDHTEAGERAAARSGFPPDLAHAVRHHHAEDFTSLDGATEASVFILRAVSTASYGAIHLGFPAGYTPEPTDGLWTAPLAPTLPEVDLDALHEWFESEREPIALYVETVLG